MPILLSMVYAKTFVIVKILLLGMGCHTHFSRYKLVPTLTISGRGPTLNVRF